MPTKDGNWDPIKGKPGAKPGHRPHHRKKAPFTNPSGKTETPETHRPSKKKQQAGVVPHSDEAAPVENPAPTDGGSDPSNDRAEATAQFHGVSVENPALVEEVHRHVGLDDPSCPKCGSQMKHHPSHDRVREQFELRLGSILRIIFHMMAYWCPKCQKYHWAGHPVELKTGFFGARLMALITLLKGANRVSISGIQEFLKELGLTVCRGLVCKLLDKTAIALDSAYAGLKMAIPEQAKLNIDETGHKDSGKTHWTWVFRAASFCLFAINPGRGSSVLFDMLAGFKGIIVCDFFSAYRKFLKCTGLTCQFCIAHLKRDFKYLTGFKNRPDLVQHGESLLGILKELCMKYRWLLRLKGLDGGRIRRRDPGEPDYDSLDDETRASMAADVLEQCRELGNRLADVATKAPPDHRLARNIAKRFDDYGDFYLTFLSDEGLGLLVGPSNNPAEQSLEPVVLDRRVTQGTRGAKGQWRCERFWTIIETCKLQKRSAFDFIKHSIQAYYAATKDPASKDIRPHMIKARNPSPDRPFPTLLQ